MKNELINIINEIIELLTLCNYSDRARWFQDKLDVLLKEDIDSEIAQSHLIEIKNILSGMGSFTDLSLVPPHSSNLSVEDARKKQWELAERLDKILRQIIDS